MVKQHTQMVHSVSIAVCTIFFYLLTTAADAAEIPEPVNRQQIFLAAAKGMTTIDDGNIIFFVDYKHALLTKWQRLTGECVRYDMSSGQVDDSKLVNRMTMFSGVERLPDQPDDPYPVKLMLAPAAMKTRTVTAPKLAWYDFIVEPEVLQLTLGADKELFNDLQEIAKANMTLYDSVTLIHWYDMVSLIPYLDGVPETGYRQAGCFTYTFSLVPYAEQQRRLAEFCGR